MAHPTNGFYNADGNDTRVITLMRTRDRIEYVLLGAVPLRRGYGLET